MPQIIKCECGYRMAVTPGNAGIHIQCRCGTPLFVPYDFNFWCHHDDALDDVFAAFRKLFPSDDDRWTRDQHETLEWVDGKSNCERIGFNISTQPDPAYPDDSSLVRISLLVFDASLTRDKIGKMLAGALRTEVCCDGTDANEDARGDAEQVYRP